MADITLYKSYAIGSDLSLTEENKHALVACFKKPAEAQGEVLAGRAAVSKIHLNGIGDVVVKNYTRGGFIKHFIKRTYLKISSYRCQSEYELLQYLKRLDVSVPKPVAFVYQGSLLYHAWLVTKEIRNTCTLAELSIREPSRAELVMGDVVRQVSILAENQVHHVDLHPGNVLVDDKNNLFIIDFDKARTNPQNPIKLLKKYISRWQRAVKKHELPEVLNDIKKVI